VQQPLTKLLRGIVKYVTLARTAIVVIISTAIVANVAGEPPVRIAGVSTPTLDV
jgi:hypothetical protein